MRGLLSLFAIGVLIFLHELGHLVVARLLGIRASQVTFGFGPPLYSLRRQRLRLSLGAIPLGGSVELEGENPHRVEPERSPRGYSAQPPWKRLLVLLGGPLTSFAIAPLALFLLYIHGTHVVVPLTVGMVVPGSAAAHAQVRPGDKVVALEAKPVESWATLNHQMTEAEGRPVTLTVSREGTSTNLTLIPQRDGNGQVSIGLSQQYVYRALPRGEAMRQAFGHSFWLAGAELRLVGKLILGVREGGLAQAGLTVREVTDAAAAGGLDSVLRALAGLSVALAMFYLVPIPALDGGRVVIVAWELWRKRRLDPRVLTLYQTLGLLLLLGLLAWVAVVNLLTLMQVR